MSYFQKLWHGDIRLGMIFWFYGIFVLFLLRIIEVSAASNSPTAGQVAFLISLVYYLFYSIVLWRTTAKEEFDFMYTRLARIFLLVGWGRYLLSANLLGAGFI